MRNKEIFRKPCKFLEKDRDVKLVKREKKKVFGTRSKLLNCNFFTESLLVISYKNETYIYIYIYIYIIYIYKYIHE